MTRRPATMLQPGRVPLCLALLLLVAMAATAPLLAATPKDLYTAALTDERRLRAPAGEPPALAQLRDTIAAYIEIVRQYPRSEYSDNALWQAAGLAIQAFDRHRQPTDRDGGMRFLRKLEREYPESSFVPRVPDRRERLRRLDAPVQILAIHREPLADIVRVTIELDDEVRYDAERLERPARLFFDFSGTYAPPPLRDATLAYDDGDMVREIRLGRHPGQTTRVVLDIEDVDTYSVYSLYNPYRLVIDAVPTSSMQARRAILDTSTVLAARGDTPVAVDRRPSTYSGRPELGEGLTALTLDPDPGQRGEERSHPASSGSPRSNPTGVLPRPASETADADALTTGLGATPDLHRGPLAVPGDTGPPPTDQVDELTPVETADVAERAATAGASNDSPSAPASDSAVLQLDALPAAASEPGTSVNPRAADMAPSRMTASDLLPVPEDWEARVLDPLLPDRELVTVTPLRSPDAVAPATPVLPGSTVDVLPLSRGERTVQISQQAPASAAAPIATVAVESFGYAEERPSIETPVANSDGAFSLGRQLGLGVSLIVIDPGHGGYDPGAKTGALTESALVLDVARRLEARLVAETGIGGVILTRRGDAYMPLRARTELANRVGADLFLSIHANAASDRRVRGVETYYLDLTTDPTAQMVAARENAPAREGMHDLPKLVQSITMHNKRDESRDFAEMVQRNLIRAVRELHPEAQDLGVKQAPFVVLIGTNMPSVLAEISFLTNQEEAAFLATDAYRDRIADALLQSILEYQRTLKPHPSFTDENND